MYYLCTQVNTTIKMKLSNIAEISIGVPISRYKYNPANDSKKISYSLFSQNMLSDTGMFQEFEAEIFFANKDLSNSCTQSGDVIFGLRAPNQAIYMATTQSLLVQSYMAIIRCDPTKVLPEYLALKLNAQEIQNQLYKNIQGGMIKLVQVQNLRELSIELPSIKKQQQIVAIAQTGYQEIEVLKQLIEEKQKILKAIV